jgi:hypothetical protein
MPYAVPGYGQIGAREGTARLSMRPLRGVELRLGEERFRPPER